MLWWVLLAASLVSMIADWRFGLGYVLFGFGLIGTAMAVAGLFGIEFETQEPFIEILAIPVFVPIFVRLGMVMYAEASKPQAKAGSNRPGNRAPSANAQSARDRNAANALGALRKGAFWAKFIAFNFVVGTLVVMVIVEIFSKEIPPAVGVGIPLAGSYIAKSIGEGYTESPFRTALWAGGGFLLGGLLVMAAAIINFSMRRATLG